jgi:DNA replication protein DnaC
MHTAPEVVEEDVRFEELAPAGQPVAVAENPTPSARPLVEHEPQHIMVAAEDDSISAYVARWEAEKAREPENTQTLGVCKHCGVSLGDKLEDKVIPIGRMFLPNICCTSCSEAGKARLEAEAEKAKQAQFLGIVPTEFLSWDTGKGNNQALAAARSHFSITARRGLVLHGTSGTCKTRIMWELVKHVVSDSEGFTICVLDAFEAATTTIPKDAYMADFLFIDDLGNEPKTRKFETNLLHLLRRRFDWHKPVVITTQLTAQEFMVRFFEGQAAKAIARRLRENCGSIATDKITQPQR